MTTGLILLVLCSLAVRSSMATQLPDLYWNSSNPTFAKAGGVMTVQLRDRIDIYCPFYDRPVRNPEYLSVYMVSSFGYKKCTIYDAKPVLICKNPYRQNFVSVVFRRFTPNPSGLEFTPGKTYYFITTSGGDYDGIYNRKGGLCEKNSLRMRIKVNENNPEPLGPGVDISFANALKPSKNDRYQLDEQHYPSYYSPKFPKSNQLPASSETLLPELRNPDSENILSERIMMEEATVELSLPNPLAKLYPKERARLRFLMEYLDRMRTTTPSLPVIDYVIGYEASPEFLRSSQSSSLHCRCSLLTLVTFVLLFFIKFC